jgi:hypothetical protein
VVFSSWLQRAQAQTRGREMYENNQTSPNPAPAGTAINAERSVRQQLRMEADDMLTRSKAAYARARTIFGDKLAKKSAENEGYELLYGGGWRKSRLLSPIPIRRTNAPV